MIESDLLIEVPLPLKAMMDVIRPPGARHSSLYGYVEASDIAHETVRDLQSQLESSETTLTISQKELENLRLENAALKSSNAKLKKRMNNERISFDPRYHRDFGARIEEEKAKLTAHLHDANVKAHHYDIAASTLWRHRSDSETQRRIATGTLQTSQV